MGIRVYRILLPFQYLGMYLTISGLSTAPCKYILPRHGFSVKPSAADFRQPEQTSVRPPQVRALEQATLAATVQVARFGERVAPVS